jgi:hypothetical protein
MPRNMVYLNAEINIFIETTPAPVDSLWQRAQKNGFLPFISSKLFFRQCGGFLYMGISYSFCRSH